MMMFPGGRKMKRTIMILIFVSVVIFVAIFFTARQRYSINQHMMLLSGNIEVIELNIGFNIPGRVIERPVDEGMYVKKGDVLAKIDSKELASLVLQQRAQLNEAKVKLDELKAGSRAQEIEQAIAGLKAANAELIKAKKDFERAEILYENGAIPSSKFDEAKSIYDARSALYKKAEETLSLVSEGPRKEVIEAATLRVDQAKAQLAVSEERLKEATIYAPIDGVILKKYVEIGETIQAGQPVVTLGDIERPWVKVYVKEDKIGLIKLGQKALINIDTFKNKTYEGLVTYISSAAEFTPKTVQTHEERVKLVFGVKVSVKNQNGELKPGMPADVRILTE